MNGSDPHPFPAMRDVRLEPLAERPSLVSIDDFCSVPEPLAGFGDFVDSLPDIYAGTVFKKLVASIVAARRANRPVVFAMGAHVLKVGLAPLIIDLMRRGVITDVVLNSAGAIHDFELATVGRTSEDVVMRRTRSEAARGVILANIFIARNGRYYFSMRRLLNYCRYVC